jgi:hypothetical protein
MGKMNEPRKIVYLKRGLPACGKSHMARRLAGEKGLVLETDQFFYSQVGDDPAKYDYSEELLPTARAWNLDRFHPDLDDRLALRHHRGSDSRGRSVGSDQESGHAAEESARAVDCLAEATFHSALCPTAMPFNATTQQPTSEPRIWS